MTHFTDNQCTQWTMTMTLFRYIKQEIWNWFQYSEYVNFNLSLREVFNVFD